jgi:hypothetical protein
MPSIGMFIDPPVERSGGMAIWPPGAAGEGIGICIEEPDCGRGDMAAPAWLTDLVDSDPCNVFAGWFFADPEWCARLGLVFATGFLFAPALARAGIVIPGMFAGIDWASAGPPTPINAAARYRESNIGALHAAKCVGRHPHGHAYHEQVLGQRDET